MDAFHVCSAPDNLPAFQAQPVELHNQRIIDRSFVLLGIIPNQTHVFPLLHNLVLPDLGEAVKPLLSSLEVSIPDGVEKG